MGQDIFLGIGQNYLLFLPAKRYIKCFSGTTRIDSRKSDEILEKNIKNITRSGSNFVDHHILPNININGHISHLLKKQ